MLLCCCAGVAAQCCEPLVPACPPPPNRLPTDHPPDPLSSSPQSEWEEAYAEDEDKENVLILEQVLLQLAQEAAAAKAVNARGGEAAAPQGDDFAVFADPDDDADGSQGIPAELRSEDGGILGEWELEHCGSGSEGADGGTPAGPASPAPPSPLAAVLEQLGADVQQVVQLCHHTLQVGADTAFQLDDLRTAAGCTRAELKKVRQEVDARFTAIEKTLFYIQRQLAIRGECVWWHKQGAGQEGAMLGGGEARQAHAS